MNRQNLNYSMKNIPIPNNNSYKLLLIEKIEAFIKRMRWKAHFYISDLENDTKNDEKVKKKTFGFKTKNTPPVIKELEKFENDLFDIAKNISFKNINNEFQNKLKSDVSKIRNNPNVLVFADKTNNIYELTKKDHNKLLIDNITKTYKAAPKKLEHSINLEAKRISKKLNLEDRIECIAKNEAFITLKDHKPNFNNDKPCRLLVPSKSEIGHISKCYLDRINSEIREKLKVNQWKNTTDVISWFEKIGNKKEKKKYTFIQFDIQEFYPKITKELFEKALTFAKTHTTIKRDELSAIRHARKSLLFHKNETWIKSKTSNSFDVTMGSYDGAEVCELVGLYILNELKKEVPKEDVGLYRDDGLIIVKHESGPISEQLKKKLIQIFNNIGFQIDIRITLKIVDFLDVTFNLKENSYKPYKKPNDKLLYINTESNHPPNIIKHIPININKRLNQNSSSKKVFDKSKKEYEDALKESGYKNFKLEYNPQKQQPKTKKNRKRDIIWFNPPFNKSVTTNIGKQFLDLIKKHFPPQNRLHKIFNKNTVKLSYSCTKNMKKIITGHNKKILSEKKKEKSDCNCTKKQDCPLEGKNCREKSVIYKCIASVPEKPDKVYIGLTEAKFKTRHSGHKTTFNHERYKKGTTLSTYFWNSKEKEKIDPILKWSILKSVPAYSNITKRCPLCLQEKFEILFYKNQGELLNKRSELISKCRHQNKFILGNLT